MGNVLTRLLSTLSERNRFARGLGKTFRGNRDMYEALGYKEALGIDDYKFRYERGDIGARIIDVYPNDTWAGDPQIIEDPNPEVYTAFEQACFELNERLGFFSIFRRSDILAGIGRYSIIFIGAPGEPSQPIGRLTKPEDIAYLIPLGEDHATISSSGRERDPKSPRYGQPVSYSISGLDDDVSTSTNASLINVHWSRVIHIVANKLDSNIYGQPELKNVWNRLDDLDKVVGGGSEAFWLRANRGMQFDIDKDLKVADDQKTQMTEQLDEFEHGMRRFLRTRGITTTEFGSDVADFKDPAMTIVSIISGAKSIPQRLLLGSERGELASSQDAKNWEARIKARRNSFALPTIIRPFIDRLIEVGALPKPSEYTCEWPAGEELDQKERGELADKWSKLNSNMGETVVTSEEVRTHVLGLEPFTAAQQAEIDAAAEELRQQEADAAAEAAARLNPPDDGVASSDEGTTS